MLSVLVVVHEVRWLVPAGFLSLSMVPYASASIALAGASWLISRSTWEAADDWMYTRYLRMCLFVFENLSGNRLVISGDVDALRGCRERAVVLSNHQSDADWAVIAMLAARSGDGAERGLRFMVKHSIQFVPLFGWYTFFRGYVFVRRDGLDTAAVQRQLRWLDKSPSFWLHIFPEGTRISNKSLKASNEFRESRGLPPLSQVLSPRPTGLRIALETLQSAEAVYDITIGYSQTVEGAPPGMFSFVCCAPSEVHVHIRRHEIPRPEMIPTWIEERFIEKEQLLTRFRSTGHLVDDAVPEPSISFSLTVPPTLLFLSALLAARLPPIATLFKYTVCSAPILLLTMKFSRYI